MALRKFTYIDATEGFSTEQGASDQLSLGKITLLGVSGVALDGGGAEAVNFLDPTTAQSLATKAYVDAVAAGLYWKTAVRAATNAALAAVTAAGSGVGKTLTENASGALTVDGVTMNNGDRVLIKNQVAGSDNGIYTVTDKGSVITPFILTRATDADTSAEVKAGLAVFSTEGTVGDNVGWVVTTNNPITLDTTSLAFSQFTAAATYTFDQGLLLTGASVTVELDTSAAAQTAGAGGGSSGLEFDANTASGKLRAAVHATGGLQRSATGLQVLLDTTTVGGTTLASAAAGLSVLAAPLQKRVFLDSTGGLAVGDPVCIDTADHIVKGAGSALATSRVIGVSLSTTVTTGDPATIVSHGIAPGVLSSATANTPYFMASGGGLTATRPTGGSRIIRVGFALNATDLWVSVQDLGLSV